MDSKVILILGLVLLTFCLCSFPELVGSSTKQVRFQDSIEYRSMPPSGARRSGRWENSHKFTPGSYRGRDFIPDSIVQQYGSVGGKQVTGRSKSKSKVLSIQPQIDTFKLKRQKVIKDFHFNTSLKALRRFRR